MVPVRVMVPVIVMMPVIASGIGVLIGWNRIVGRGFDAGVVMTTVRTNRRGFVSLARGACFRVLFTRPDVEPCRSMTENDHTAEQSSEDGSEQRKHQIDVWGK